MDSQSLFLTANADTVYFVGIVDLTSGPMVVETPPQALALFDDMWFHWIVDFGLLGPGSRRRRPFPAGPARLRRLPARQRLPRRPLAHDKGDPARPVVHDENPTRTRRRPSTLIKSTLKLYPYAQGGFGTSVGTLLEGGQAAASPGGGHSRDEVRRREREGVQHDPAERLRLLRAAERGGPGRARRQHDQHRADGGAGRDRDRQGQAVQAGRADAAHPRGCGRRRERGLAGPGLRRRGHRRGSGITTTARRGSILLLGRRVQRSRLRRRSSPRTESSRCPRPAPGR